MTTTRACALLLACVLLTVSVVASVKSKPHVSNSAGPTCKGTLPVSTQWNALKGTKWNLTTVGTMKSSSMPSLGWDKCRSSLINGKLFYNFGDTLGGGSQWIGMLYGFGGYSNISNPWVVNTNGRTTLAGSMNYAPPYPGTRLTPGYSWGMECSNAPDTGLGYGVAFVWEIQRMGNGSTIEDGGAIVKVTVDSTLYPTATRFGPITYGPGHVQIGIVTAFADPNSNYIYVYGNGNNGQTLVTGRVLKTQALDIKNYQFLKSSGAWVQNGVPLSKDSSYGIQFMCYYGSMMYSNYLSKYVLFCGQYQVLANFYTSDTPYGPWSGNYQLSGKSGQYGIGVHPMLSPSCDSTFYFTSTINNVQTAYRVDMAF